MGFNLGAFGAGLATGVADTMEKQRKDMDGRIDKYLDFGVQRGAEVMDKRKLQRTELTRLGNQLQQRNLSDEQISVLLEGGAESAKEFLTAVQIREKTMPDGKVFDAGSLVTMENEKPSTMKWQDYIDKRIMGTVNTGNAFSGSGIRSSSDGSILGKMFGVEDTGTVSTDAVRRRAGIVGNTMGMSMEDALAASQNSFDRMTDDKAAKGYVRLAGDPLAQQQLLTDQQRYTNLQMQATSIKLAMQVTADDKPNVDAQRALTTAKLASDDIVQKYAIANNIPLNTLKKKFELLEKQVKMADEPANYEQANMYFAHQVGTMLRTPKEERTPEYHAKLSLLQQEQLNMRVDSIAYFALKAGLTGDKVFTQSLLTKLYQTTLDVAITKNFSNGTEGVFYYDAKGDRFLQDPNDPDNNMAFKRARSEAYDMWRETLETNKANGTVYNLMDDILKSYKMQPADANTPPEFLSATAAATPQDTAQDNMGAIVFDPTADIRDIVATKVYIITTTKGKKILKTGQQILDRAGYGTGATGSTDDNQIFSQGPARVWGDTSNVVEEETTLLDGSFREDKFPEAYGGDAVTPARSRAMIVSLGRDARTAMSIDDLPRIKALLEAANTILPIIDASRRARLQGLIVELTAASE